MKIIEYNGTKLFYEFVDKKVHFYARLADYELSWLCSYDQGNYIFRSNEKAMSLGNAKNFVAAVSIISDITSVYGNYKVEFDEDTNTYDFV